MNKHDWTVVLVRLLGLYLVGVHLGTFLTAFAALCLMIAQRGAPWVFSNVLTWQGCAVSALALIIGLTLIFQAPGIVRYIDRSEGC